MRATWRNLRYSSESDSGHRGRQPISRDLHDSFFTEGGADGRNSESLDEFTCCGLVENNRTNFQAGAQKI